MTATTNGHRPTLLKRNTDTIDLTGSGYPEDDYGTLDVDEVAPTPPPDLPAPAPDPEDSGAVPLVKYPILPAWATSAGGVRRNVRHNAPILLNNAIYWAVTQRHALDPFRWVLAGGRLAVVELYDYAVDRETLELKRDARKAKQGKVVQHWRKERWKTRRPRALWTLAWTAGAVAVGAVVFSPEVPPVPRTALGLVVLVALAGLGRARTPEGETGTSAALRPDQDRDPAKSLVDSERVVQVFKAANTPGVLTFGGTHRRGSGAEGWETVVDLPDGTTFDEVQGRHAKLCSAWRIPKERLYLQRGGHEGQVHMTVFDKDPMTGDPLRTPLRDLKLRSFWDPVPIGLTAYGDPYSLVLPGTSGVWVCSAPGYGKTNFLQLILAAAALEIRVEIYIHDGKGEGDLEVYRDLAVHFSQGSNDSAGRDCLKMLQRVRALKTKRADLIRKVRAERPDLMPSSQITRAVTEDPQWGLPLILVMVDELNLMAKTSSGEDIQKEVCGIAEGCRSGGIVPVIAGQNFRADVLNGAQASIGTRVAFKTNTPEDSNLILGKGQVGDGFNTSKWPDNYQGVSIIRPAGKQAQSGTHQVKVHLGEYADHVAIAAHCARQRIAAGGPVVLAKSEVTPLLDRVLQAMGDRNIVPVDEAAGALGIADVEVLVEQLRESGVPCEKSRGHGNKRAVRRADVLKRM